MFIFITWKVWKMTLFPSNHNSVFVYMKFFIQSYFHILITQSQEFELSAKHVDECWINALTRATFSVSVAAWGWSVGFLLTIEPDCLKFDTQTNSFLISYTIISVKFEWNLKLSLSSNQSTTATYLSILFQSVPRTTPIMNSSKIRCFLHGLYSDDFHQIIKYR